MDRRLSLVIGCAITFVWAVSFLADIFRPDYTAPPSLHEVMMLLAGAAFGSQFINKGDKSG